MSAMVQALLAPEYSSTDRASLMEPAALPNVTSTFEDVRALLESTKAAQAAATHAAPPRAAAGAPGGTAAPMPQHRLSTSGDALSPATVKPVLNAADGACSAANSPEKRQASVGRHNSFSIAAPPPVRLDASMRSVLHAPPPAAAPSLDEILSENTWTPASTPHAASPHAASQYIPSPLGAAPSSALLAELQQHLGYTREAPRQRPPSASRPAPRSAAARPGSARTDAQDGRCGSNAGPPQPGDVVQPRGTRQARPGTAESARSTAGRSPRPSESGRATDLGLDKALYQLYGSHPGPRVKQKPSGGARTAWDSSLHRAPLPRTPPRAHVAGLSSGADSDAAVELARSKLGSSCIVGSAASASGGAGGGSAPDGGSDLVAQQAVATRDLAAIFGTGPPPAPPAEPSFGGARDLAALLASSGTPGVGGAAPSSAANAVGSSACASFLDRLADEAARHPSSPTRTDASCAGVSSASGTSSRRRGPSVNRLAEIEQALRTRVADHTPAYEKGQTVLTKVFRAFDPYGQLYVSSGAFRKILGVFEIDATEAEARAIVASSPRPSNPPVERALYYDKYITQLFVSFKPRPRAGDSSALAGATTTDGAVRTRAELPGGAWTAPSRAGAASATAKAPSSPLRHEEKADHAAAARRRAAAVSSPAEDAALTAFLDQVGDLFDSVQASEPPSISTTPGTALDALLGGKGGPPAAVAGAPLSSGAREATAGSLASALERALAARPADGYVSTDRSATAHAATGAHASSALDLLTQLESSSLHPRPASWPAGWGTLALMDLRDQLLWRSVEAGLDRAPGSAATAAARLVSPAASALDALLAPSNAATPPAATPATAAATAGAVSPARLTRGGLLQLAAAAVLPARAALAASDWKGGIELRTATGRDSAAAAHTKAVDAARRLWEADPILDAAEWRELERRYAGFTTANSAQVATILLALSRAVERASAARTAIRQRLKLLAHARSLVEQLAPRAGAAGGGHAPRPPATDDKLRSSRLAQLRSLIGLLRQAGVQVVEAVMEWRAMYRHPVPFEWEGTNYLIAIQSQHVALPRALIDELHSLGGRPTTADTQREDIARRIIEAEGPLQAARARQAVQKWTPPPPPATPDGPAAAVLRWQPVDEGAMRAHLWPGLVSAPAADAVYYYELAALA
eukprot:scaffold3185_cov111-Isochrysis_galbana.AAC.1